MATEAYVRAVLAWQAKMDAEIRVENGWLAWVGEFWLKNGPNTLGSAPESDVHLPKQAPWQLGVIKADGVNGVLEVHAGQSVEVNGLEVKTASALKADDEKTGSIITMKGLRMVMMRGEQGLGLRLWDNLRTRELPRRAWYEVDDKFCMKALYTAYPAPVKVEMPNVAGGTESGYVQGYVSFKLDGKSYNMDATELDDGKLYVQFSDLTNGAKTYPKGRYLETEAVEEDGRVVADFNKAYNPPCAFKEGEPGTFAPSGNHLKAAIEAGEQYGIRADYGKGTLTL